MKKFLYIIWANNFSLIDILFITIVGTVIGVADMSVWLKFVLLAPVMFITDVVLTMIQIHIMKYCEKK